jgi:hypothetical protein
LIRGRYAIEDAVVRNPRVHLVIDAEGRDNLPRPPKSDSKTAKTDYFIDKLVVLGGGLRAEDRRNRMAINLPIRQIVVDGNLAENIHDVQIEAANSGNRHSKIGVCRSHISGKR